MGQRRTLALMHGRPPSDDAKKQRRDRQRRWRQRQGDGALSVLVEVTPADTSKLARLEYLGLHELEDRKRISEAIRALLAAIVLDV